MSYCEDCVDPFDRDDDESFFDHDEEDKWECCFPDNCCMAFAPHMSDECHTPEMAEEWFKEQQNAEAGRRDSDAGEGAASSK